MDETLKNTVVVLAIKNISLVHGQADLKSPLVLSPFGTSQTSRACYFHRPADESVSDLQPDEELNVDARPDLANLFSSINAHMNANMAYIQKKLTEINCGVDEVKLTCKELRLDNEKLRKENKELRRKIALMGTRLDHLEAARKKVDGAKAKDNALCIAQEETLFYDSVNVLEGDNSVGMKDLLHKEGKDEGLKNEKALLINAIKKFTEHMEKDRKDFDDHNASHLDVKTELKHNDEPVQMRKCFRKHSLGCKQDRHALSLKAKEKRKSNRQNKRSWTLPVVTMNRKWWVFK